MLRLSVLARGLARTLLASAILLALPLRTHAQSYTISTVAGGALPVNIPATSASLYGPQTAIAIDSAGNIFFVDGNTVLRLDAVTKVLALVAGNGTAGYSGDNGPAVAAQLHSPNGIALDAVGNLYISSFYDNVVRKVSGGTIVTIVGTGTAGIAGDNGPATGAQLNSPSGLAVDSAGNLYIADSGNNRIREVSAGVITTVAGAGASGFSGDSGLAIAAQLNAPRGIAVDSGGNVYIADCGNNRIRKVSSGVISTMAGNGSFGFGGDNGPATAAQLNFPSGIAFDSSGNLWIADYYNNRVREVANGIITTAAGKGTQGFSGDSALATKAQLNNPFVVAVDLSGNVYIADYGNNRIRKVASGIISTVAGNGTTGFSGDGGSANGAQLHGPLAVALDASGDLYIADYLNNRIRTVSAGVISTIAGTGLPGFSGDAGPPVLAQLNQPSAAAVDSAGNIYIADTGNNRIRKISAGIITTVAGNGTAGFSGDSGPAAGAELNQPAGIALDSSGNLYIADSANNRIRKVSSGNITTVAGNGVAGFSGDAGSPTSAQLNSPLGVSLDSAGNLYIADTGNNRIRKVSAGLIATVAGNGVASFSGDNGAAPSAGLNAPAGVTVTSGGGIYIADTGNNAIRRVSAGTIVTVAGGGTSFGDNGPALSAELASPQSIALDASGNGYIADTIDNRVRLVTPVPLSITSPTSLPSGTVNAAYAAVTFTAIGGSGVYTWSATGLPKGLTFSPGGILSGSPTAAGTSTVQFTVKDSALNTASSSLALTIALSIPAITTLSPAAATVYGSAFTLTVNGSGFLTGAIIQWNGLPLTTKVVSGTQVTASVAASLIAGPAVATITVSSGGNSSNSVSFPINAPTPTLTAINPASATATGAAFNMTATGTGFVQASQLQWNGSALQTTFVSATQLTASVSAGLLAGAGTASVTVNSGGTSSSAATFTINPPPALAALSPASVTAYGPAFTLTVSGTGFASGAVVQWNGTALATKFVGATQLTASVPAGTVTGAGNANIVVVSGGISTSAFLLSINPPPPTITMLSPASATATGTAFTLTVNGADFMQSSIVQWNGAALPTAFVSASQLSAYVSASLIANSGNASIVVNSAGTSSAAATFAINPPPSVAALNPAFAVAGAAGFTLTVTGAGFISGAQVQWNGAPLTTTFVSATQLTAPVSAALIANIASATLSVSFGGASSNGAIFGVISPPAITTLSPASATAGGAAFTLTVNGTGFISGAAVSWNATALTTKFVSATQLTASIAASLIANVGTANVAINSGGTSSSPSTFTINPLPAISALNPGTVAGTGEPFTLTLNGTGFLSGVTVQWNGTALATTFVSAGQLTAAVPANLAAGAGTASITAINPGGATSAAMKLPITAVPPAVTQGGVVPIYSAATVIQAGSWISIYGTGLANGTYLWKGDFPTTLGGTSVKIDNKLAYLWSVSPTQINLQAPADTATGSVNVVVTTASGSSTSTVTLAPYGPSFSLLPGSSYAAAVILTPDGSGAYGSGAYDLAGPANQFSFKTRPVKSGETMELFGVGFGPTNPTVPPGKAYTGAAPTANPVSVTIGGVTAKLLFSGITEAGVYQFNLIVPQVSSGDQPLLATVSGVATPLNVLITLQ